LKGGGDGLSASLFQHRVGDATQDPPSDLVGMRPSTDENGLATTYRRVREFPPHRSRSTS
jgi:hypothetical protein